MDKKIVVGVLALMVICIAAFVGLSLGVFSPTGYEVIAASGKNRPVKEFAMESFVEFVGGQPKPQYSLKEITVNRGDLVRIKITVTSGMHDFKIDEYNVYADTPLNQEIVVEFVADKAGEFVYYCTKPGHRQNGHWGALRVLE